MVTAKTPPPAGSPDRQQQPSRRLTMKDLEGYHENHRSIRGCQENGAIVEVYRIGGCTAGRWKR